MAALVLVCGCSTDNGLGDVNGYDFGPMDVGADVAVDVAIDTALGELLPNTGSKYPDVELLIRITGPSGRGYSTVTGSIVALSGIVFGKVTKLTWNSSAASGTVELLEDSPFWQTDGIQLAEGDNILSVVAEGPDGQVSDSIMVTYNNGFLLPNALKVRPPALFVGQTQAVLATLVLGPFGNIVGSALTIKQVDAVGKPILDLGQMVDNGLLKETGDEIVKDGVYTIRLTVSCTTPGPIFYRAAVPFKDATGNSYFALTEPARFECVPRLEPDICQSHQQTLVNARDGYLSVIAAGGDIAGAREAAVKILVADPAVAQSAAVADSGGLWVRWNDGVLGAVNLGRDGLRGGGEPGVDAAPLEMPVSNQASVSSALAARVPIRSKETLLLSPFADEFGENDETLDISNQANLQACPAFRVSSASNAAANLDRFRRLSSYGIVAVATHADAYFGGLSAELKGAMGWKHPGSAEVLWTGETVACSNLSQVEKICTNRKECNPGQDCILTMPRIDDETPASGQCFDATQTDLMTGRVILGDRTWAVAPAFLDRHMAGQEFPSSLVYLGGCKTLYNGTLATTLFAAGARAILGYSGTVSSRFAAHMGSQFFIEMMKNGDTAERAYNGGAQDPAHPGSAFRLFGANGLSVSESVILNEGFEFGELTAWASEGDGRVITKLGVTKPVEGKFMGIISTGLGFTTSNGSLEQKFCVFPGATRMSFWWKYYSEEFKEFCGQKFQDAFLVSLRDHQGTLYQLASLKVDDLCDKSDTCLTCGSQSVGLVESDVSFDKGNVWVTGTTKEDITNADGSKDPLKRGDWQRVEYDISGMVSSDPVPITLRFYTEDKGDSIYDTAVLLDGVKFE